jgi:hypothetical protein
MIDSRTTDQSVLAIEEILNGQAEYEIVPYKFEGFGPARTDSLETVWQYFPQATHVIIADPDWRPEVSSMNKAELDLEHDVFRFLAYDRNGQTTRRMDWMLRNREGLKMRYNLHEVLDIGLYSVKYVSWFVREIEKPGTWHTSVGHESSVSAKRFLFDLELLQKDLLIYKHDPHVHYYLGVTHQAYVEQSALTEGKLSNTTSNHLENSIKYLRLRILSEYDDDFIEQRWSAMIILGSIYANLKNDFINAEHWFSACRDYNPKQSECGMALTKLYYSYGSLDLAYVEIIKVLQSGNELRIMHNWLRSWECDTPKLAFTIFTQYILFYRNKVQTGDAIYLLLMRHMMSNHQCGYEQQEYTLSSEATIAVDALLHTSPAITVSASSSVSSLCDSDIFAQYILNNGYKLHPCDTLKRDIKMVQTCGDFAHVMSPPSEEYQTRDRQEFIGSASLPDVVHHVYGGDSNRLYPSGMPYRVLFAEYFNPKNLYSLLGRTKFPIGSHLEITVLVPSGTIAQKIRETVKQCMNSCKSLEIIELSLNEYSKQLMSKMMVRKNKGTSYADYLYDFIEYNGGMSIDPLYKEILNMMSKVRKYEIFVTIHRFIFYYSYREVLISVL